MLVAVIGMGHVGKITAELLMRSHDVVQYDKFVPGLAGRAEVNTCEAAFVCVPTPMGADGSCDLSIVEEVMGWLTTPVRVIRCTVPPNTCTRFSATHWPEFYGEWPTPILHGDPWPDNTLLGGPHWSDVADILKTCYPSRHIFAGYDDAVVTEIAKLAENSFFAVKIELANVLCDVSTALGAKWEHVRNAWTLDPRIGADHTTVRETERGFGGKCLPKDTTSLLHVAEQCGVSAEILKATLESNQKRRPLESNQKRRP